MMGTYFVNEVWVHICCELALMFHEERVGIEAPKNTPNMRCDGSMHYTDKPHPDTRHSE